MPAFHQVAADTFRYLVERHGYRTIVFESAWGVEEAMADFVRSERTSFSAEESFFLNAFASPATLELMLWVRAWNRAHPNDMLRVTGYQPEQPVTDADALRAVSVQIGLSREVDEALSACRLPADTYPTNIDFLIMTFARRRDGQPVYNVAERETCIAGLRRIEGEIAAHRARMSSAIGVSRLREVGLHLQSLSTYVTLLSLAGDAPLLGDQMPLSPSQMQSLGYSEGDRVRFEIFEALRETRNDRTTKTFLWMHNWHAARHASEITMAFPGAQSNSTASSSISLGERIAARYGANAFTIAHVTPCGSTCAEPAQSLETAFAAAFDGSVRIMTFDDADAQAFPLDQKGELYANNHRAGFSNVELRRQFDGLIYLPRGDALPEPSPLTPAR
jgi:erythromycin esterase-like protein